MKYRTIYYATSGNQKFEEIKELIPEDIQIEKLSEDYPEIQTNDLTKICKFGAKWLANKINKPVIVDDMGLFIDYLNGLPGAFTKFLAKGIKPAGMLKLMKDVENRSAIFKVCLGFCEPKNEPITFIAERKGKIAFKSTIGPYDFGFNSIFVPEGSDKSLAEYSFKEKIKNEPRRKAFKELIEFIKK